MQKIHSFRSVIATSALASVLSVAALWLVHGAIISPESAFAQSPASPDVVLYAMPRGSSNDSQSFIFHNAETGDIWVYRNHKFRDHYRLTELGVDMEKNQ